MTEENEEASAVFDAIAAEHELSTLREENRRLRDALEKIVANREWGCYAHTGEDHYPECNVGIARAVLSPSGEAPKCGTCSGTNRVMFDVDRDLRGFVRAAAPEENSVPCPDCKGEAPKEEPVADSATTAILLAARKVAEARRLQMSGLCAELQ